MTNQAKDALALFKFTIASTIAVLCAASCIQGSPTTGHTPSLTSPTSIPEVEESTPQFSTLTPSPTPSSFVALIARSPAGEAANEPSYLARLSDDGGRFVFFSTATNLLPDSAMLAEAEPGINVYFRSAATNEIYSLSADRFEAISAPAISADGETAAFIGYTPGTCPDQEPQRECGSIYIYSPPSGSHPEEVPTASSYSEGPSLALSADGRFLAFAEPWGERHEGVFLYDRQTQNLIEIVGGDPSDRDSSELGPVGISADGQVVAFAAGMNGIVPEDTNDVYDVFVYNRADDTIERISVLLDGGETDQPSGRHLWGGGAPGEISVSDDGRFISYLSRAAGLTETAVPGCTVHGGEFLSACAHIYVHDRQTKQTELISVSDTGEPGNRESVESFMSGDGRWVAFTSLADNLTADSPPCEGFCPHAYLRDRLNQRTYLVSRGPGCEPVSADVSDLSGDGSLLAIASFDLQLENGQAEGAIAYTVNLPDLFEQCSG